jgi:serine/threonine-protein kinase
VHRDVKPQNVLIDQEGSAKVTDFGIARVLSEDGLTADGRVLGTTDYVSPEQALGHDVNGQSDLYSLGVVLYEMLVGDVPFKGENQVAVAMKHVREDLPDVQSRRPEVSASLAAIVDRLTDKDLGRRYPDALTVVSDLETALAVEAARSGQTTGEATAVLRTLPEETRRALPLRMRWRVPLVGLLLLVAVAAVAAGFLLKEARDNTTRGTGIPPSEPPPRTEFISVKRAAADDFDPLGDNKEEHPNEVSEAVDQEPGTAWSTENYQGGALGKAGVGLTIDASPAVVARYLIVKTPKPGWRATIYGAMPGGGRPETLSGYTRLGGGTVKRSRHRFSLATEGQAYRYYLVWITKLAEGAQKAEITEVEILKPK